MNLTRNLLFTLLFISVLTLTQCKKDDDPTPNELLIGIWQAIELDGDVVPQDEIITFEFEANHDFEWCYNYEGYSDCYDGEWNWLGNNRDKVNIEFSYYEDYSYSFNIDIEKLDEKYLEGHGSYFGSFKFIRL